MLDPPLLSKDFWTTFTNHLFLTVTALDVNDVVYKKDPDNNNKSTNVFSPFKNDSNNKYKKIKTKRNIKILVIIHCLSVWLANSVNSLLGPSDKCIVKLAYISTNYLCEILI